MTAIARRFLRLTARLGIRVADVSSRLRVRLLARGCADSAFDDGTCHICGAGVGEDCREDCPGRFGEGLAQ